MAGLRVAARICERIVGAVLRRILSEDFSSNAQGWTLGPEWQIGAATPSSGGVYNPG